jgi:hypothetical protein
MLNLLKSEAAKFQTIYLLTEDKASINDTERFHESGVIFW